MTDEGSNLVRLFKQIFNEHLGDFLDNFEFPVNESDDQEDENESGLTVKIQTDVLADFSMIDEEIEVIQEDICSMKFADTVPDENDWLLENQ